MMADATTATQPLSGEVAEVFEACSAPVGAELVALRDLILDTAAQTAGCGAITETLKWGQPAYLTSETGSGSTIRIAPAPVGADHDYAIFFICHTTLVESFRSLFGDTFTYDGERALLFKVGDRRPDAELAVCIAMALTYHLAADGPR